jgi:hypothetical protein
MWGFFWWGEGRSGIGVGTQDFVLAEDVLYHLSYTSNLNFMFYN